MHVCLEAVVPFEEIEHRLHLVGRNQLGFATPLADQVQMVVVHRHVPLPGLVSVMDVMDQPDSGELVEGPVDRGGVDGTGVVLDGVEDVAGREELLAVTGERSTDRASGHRQAESRLPDPVVHLLFDLDRACAHLRSIVASCARPRYYKLLQQRISASTLDDPSRRPERHVNSESHTDEATHEHTHDHDHHHDHESGGLWVSIRHALSEFFGMHSHDPADSVDSALESSAQGIRALKISFSVLMVTAVLQAGIVVLTGSVALLADTIHNFSDALTAVPLFVAFRLGRRAANRRYTYGYRRAEDLAGLFVVLMILISAVLAAWESINRLLDPEPIEYIGVVFAAGIIGFFGNELVALYRIRVGRKIGSAALVADGHHARVDGFTSLAVAAGAAGVWLGFDLADPIVGILVSIAILGVLRTAARDIYRRLMDAVDPELVTEIETSAMSVSGVDGIGRCQVRWLGHRLRVDLEIEVDGAISVADGHAVAERVHDQLTSDITHLDDVHVHVDPNGHHHRPDRSVRGLDAVH